MCRPSASGEPQTVSSRFFFLADCRNAALSQTPDFVTLRVTPCLSFIPNDSSKSATSSAELNQCSLTPGDGSRPFTPSFPPWGWGNGACYAVRTGTTETGSWVTVIKDPNSWNRGRFLFLEGKLCAAKGIGLPRAATPVSDQHPHSAAVGLHISKSLVDCRSNAETGWSDQTTLSPWWRHWR